MAETLTLEQARDYARDRKNYWEKRLTEDLDSEQRHYALGSFEAHRVELAMLSDVTQPAAPEPWGIGACVEWLLDNGARVVKFDTSAGRYPIFVEDGREHSNCFGLSGDDAIHRWWIHHAVHWFATELPVPCPLPPELCPVCKAAPKPEVSKPVNDMTDGDCHAAAAKLGGTLSVTGDGGHRWVGVAWTRNGPVYTADGCVSATSALRCALVNLANSRCRYSVITDRITFPAEVPSDAR